MSTILILGVPLVLLWFLVLRPAQKRQRQAAELRQSLVPGQDIVTVAGMVGTVTEVLDDDIVVSIAPGVEVRMLKGAVGQVRPLPAPVADEVDGDHDERAPAELGAPDTADAAADAGPDDAADDREPTDPGDPSEEGPTPRPS